VLTLGLASTMFEGSMYLFVFYWGPALRAAQPAGSPELPYGLIFAAFMAATLASSLALNVVAARGTMRYTALLLGLLGVSELVFYVLGAGPRSEQVTFWLFCAFEACVGLYWPAMGLLKGRLVDDGVRAQVYGFMRVPLNVFVVVSLLFTGDGEAFGPVFANCSKLLLAAVGALLAMMLNQDGLP
jgi:MFS transporter, MFS domain-containing protein family, molybdate-anion transporter